MTNKIGIIPDIHGNDKWKNAIIEHPEVDKWIFLGDYVDSYIYDDKTIMTNLLDVITYKLENKDNTTLLLGNHDIHYLDNDEWYRCSGYRKDAAFELGQIFNDYKDLFDLGTTVNDIVITHAGITESWFNRYKRMMSEWTVDITTNNITDWLNDTLHKGPKKAFDVIMHVGKLRGGMEANGGPLWADERELKMDPLQTVNQIVGHTPQKGGKPVSIKLATGETIFFTDTGEIDPMNPLILEYELEGV